MTTLKQEKENLEPTFGTIGYYDKEIGINDNKGIFAVCKVINVPLSDEEYLDQDRCDRGSIGPSGFHIWNEETSKCSCGLEERPNEITKDHIITIEDVAAYSCVIEALPYGFVVYIEMHDSELEEEMIRWPHHCRTLQEILRYIVEWAWAYEELGNREEIAEVCHGMMIVLDVPKDIYDWIVATIPPEKVGRYLAGHPDARARTTEVIPDLSDEASAWLRTKIVLTRTFGGFEKERLI